MGCLRDYLGITTGVPQLADEYPHRPTRRSRAARRHLTSFRPVEM